MKVLIKGAGDLATGIACRLYACGYQIIMTELAVPATVRRTVAFSRAVYEGEAEVEGVTALRAEHPREIRKIHEQGKVAVIVDPEVKHLEEYEADVVVDAILAKRNTGTSIGDAPLVIGAGPGFEAGKDCHFVIETQRGHYLGRVIRSGLAIPNTGIPGEVGGYSVERLIRASAAGSFTAKAAIGDRVEQGDLVALCGSEPVYARMSGMIRGMLQDGVQVYEGMKCGDIDARCDKEYCYTISDKARAVGGGVLEAIGTWMHAPGYDK